jgi:homoserine dehydrogenase
VVTGIQRVMREEISLWQREGRTPKLVGNLVRENGTFRAEVGVRTYSADDPLAQVSGKNKAIRITTQEMGSTVAISAGTEPLATAAAALKDLEHVLIARSPRAEGRFR